MTATDSTSQNPSKELDNHEFDDKENLPPVVPQNAEDTNSSTVEPKPAPENAEHDYITGLPLWMLITCITVICFLMLLDISVIVTVCRTFRVKDLTKECILGYSTDHE